MNCPRCNIPMKEGETVCINCGFQFQKYPQQPYPYYPPYPMPYPYPQQKDGAKLIILIVVILVVGMIILTIVIAGLLYVWPSSYVDGYSTPKATLKLEKQNNDWIITITGISRKIDINETTWIITYANGTTIARGETYNIYDFGKIGIEDFSGRNILRTGDWHYNDVNNSKGGYMKDDDRNNLTNPSNYWDIYSTHSQIVFMNNDGSSEPGAWKISSEDKYIIRGLENGGATQKGYILRLIWDPSDEAIASIELN